jgi:fatty acid desaturase
LGEISAIFILRLNFLADISLASLSLYNLVETVLKVYVLETSLKKMGAVIEKIYASSKRPIPVALNALIIVLQLVALAACFAYAAKITSWSGLIGLSVLFAILMNSVYSIIHEAEHAILFGDRKWNDFVGSMMALFFPAPFHLIRQGHLGHHLRNRSDDEAFDLYFEEDHWLWRFVAFYGILTGFYWLIVVLSNVVFLFWPYGRGKKYWQVDRPSAAFMDSLNPAYGRFIQLECAGAILLHGLIVCGFSIPLKNYLVMYCSFGFTWSAMQYVHHYATERHVTRGARNLWIWGPLDHLWLNHNWHLVHHEHPTIPWIYLPDIGKSESPERGWLVRAYLKMWRGPKRATEYVENKYAGRIIG